MSKARKQFQHILLDNNWQIGDNQFSKAKLFNFSFGDRYIWSYDREFPSELKTSAQKKAFIQGVYDLLEEKRENANKKARDRYRKAKVKAKTTPKKSPVKKPKKKPVKKTKKQLLDEPTTVKKDKPTTKKPRKGKLPFCVPPRMKKATRVQEGTVRGKFKESNVLRLRHLFMDYSKNIPITRETYDCVWEEILIPDLEKMIDRAYKYRSGLRSFIIKLITPHYDQTGKLMFDDDIQAWDKSSKKKTGGVTKAKTAYSYGFSTNRTVEGTHKESLKNAYIQILKDFWYQRLFTDRDSYLKNGFSRQVFLSGFVIEDVLEKPN